MALYIHLIITLKFYNFNIFTNIYNIKIIINNVGIFLFHGKKKKPRISWLLIFNYAFWSSPVAGGVVVVVSITVIVLELIVLAFSVTSLPI